MSADERAAVAAPEVLFRGPTDQDGSFIIDSWTREAREHYPHNLCDKAIFYAQYKEIVKVLMAKSMILIACNPEDTNQIYGYLCFEKVEDIPVIHFIYTKMVFRENGIARSLIDSVFEDFAKNKTIISHVPRSRKEQGKYIDSAKQTLIKYNLRYDPFLIDRRMK